MGEPEDLARGREESFYVAATGLGGGRGDKVGDAKGNQSVGVLVSGYGKGCGRGLWRRGREHEGAQRRVVVEGGVFDGGEVGEVSVCQERGDADGVGRGKGGGGADHACVGFHMGGSPGLEVEVEGDGFTEVVREVDELLGGGGINVGG